MRVFRVDRELHDMCHWQGCRTEELKRATKGCTEFTVILQLNIGIRPCRRTRQGLVSAQGEEVAPNYSVANIKMQRHGNYKNLRRSQI
jgi:hypothetical protein